MFDFDAGKFLIIGVVALIVIGPKELPRVLRQVGQMVGRVRRMATEFQGQFMDAMKEADIESIRQELKTIGDGAELNVAFDPARDIQRELTTSFEAAGAGESVALATGDVPAAATAGFALPSPAMEGEASVAEHAARLLGPAAVPRAIIHDADDPAAAPAISADAMNGAAAPALQSAKKRKIRMPKRRGLAVTRVHAVADRTAPAGGRAALVRALEVVQR